MGFDYRQVFRFMYEFMNKNNEQYFYIFFVIFICKHMYFLESSIVLLGFNGQGKFIMYACTYVSYFGTKKKM